MAAAEEASRHDYYCVGTADEGAQTVELEYDEGGQHDKGKRVYCF